MKGKLANLIHEIWSHWMIYLFSRCAFIQDKKDSDKYVIPTHLVQRWTRQIKTKYSDLPEHEKQSDRDQADKIISVIKKYL